jgi:purine-binding chemotaxis protein CheW
MKAFHNGTKELNAMDANELLTEDTQHGRFLTFALGSESYGLEISFVKEIVGLQPITPLPEVAGHVRGIINLRGGIIPVIDMHLKFGREQTCYNDRTCIVVVDIQDMQVGLIVDDVSEVLTIEDDNIVPPPDRRTGARNSYIKSIGKSGGEVKLLLDCERLLDNEKIGNIAGGKK